jgi:hypothetical protein
VGRIAVVLDSEAASSEGAHVRDLKVDTGGGAIQNVQLVAPAGVDAPPLDGDFCAFEDVGGMGVASGLFDPELGLVAEKGEVRIVARSALGAVESEVFLRKDKSVLVKNANGSFELLPNGDVKVSGNLLVDGEVTAKVGPQQVSLSSHLHGSGTGPTTAPTPGT